MNNWLVNQDEWLVYALTIMVLLGAVEGGVLLARYRHRHGLRESEQFLSVLAAPSIGLLALMVGFTFSLALTRFEARKAAVLDEANAIGTAALRGRMLADPYRDAVGPMFKEYARLRVVGRGWRIDSAENVAAMRRSLTIQDALWDQAVAAAKADPRQVPTGLFVQSLNDMIDMSETRLTAARNHVPGIVFFMLEGIAVVGLGFTGYGAAQAATQHRIAMLVMAVMIASVITLVFDLDSPQNGLITVSQQPLMDLIQGIG
ncbi:MAG: hypothetical protein WBQ75_15205 [Acetobacteraceae bacterium]